MRMIDDNVKQKLDPLSFKGQLKAYIQSTTPKTDGDRNSKD